MHSSFNVEQPMCRPVRSDAWLRIYAQEKGFGAKIGRAACRVRGDEAVASPQKPHIPEAFGCRRYVSCGASRVG